MRALFIILITAIAIPGKADIGDQYLSKFNASVSQGHVFIEFSTAHGFSCEDIRIVAGTDTINMEEINLFPGICGSEDKEVYYSFTWEDPIYYKDVFIRIDLGVFGKSSPLLIRADRVLKNESQVTPNPVNAESRLFFDLSPGASADLMIYDVNGSKVYEVTEIESGDVYIKPIGLEHGVYYYQLIGEGVSLTGKFVITKG